MSFDDSSSDAVGADVPRPPDVTDETDDRPTPLDALWRVYERLRTHVREWPGRYVEQQANVYEN
ncbi:hypothetical protein [Salarchaeum japonicum]|uniref:Uncharacterized protein n=1 Tax=Salarchaeum japonicum TaxID=555573 RepID=A0AAV3SZT3_9EURY|nr:hypothetical protein [Salarchaeum japonicum]